MTTFSTIHDDTPADAVTDALERLAEAFDFSVVDRCSAASCSVCDASVVPLAA